MKFDFYFYKRNECCTENCKKRLKDFENENKLLNEECRKKQDKNLSLQESLSAETRFKLDLFSALGEARRQLEAIYCNHFVLNHRLKTNNF